MAYKVNQACLKCGLCIKGCPVEAIIPGEKSDYGGLTLQAVSIDPEKCNDCGTCVSEEYWCPAQAIEKA
jgi:ferredoxin